MSYNQTVETAIIGRDIRRIVKDLLGIKITGAITAGQILVSYGQTPGAAADTTNGGILLDAVTRENGGSSEIIEALVRELITTSGTLQKAAMDIYIFDSYALTGASGDAFDFGTTIVKNLMQVISIAEADWETLDGNALNAIAKVALSGKNLITGSDTVMMYAVAIMRSTTKSFTTNHALQLELRIKRD